MGKCKFNKVCTVYNKQSEVCEHESGNAYGGFLEIRGGGCYRSLVEKGKESEYYRKDK